MKCKIALSTSQVWSIQPCPAEPQVSLGVSLSCCLAITTMLASGGHCGQHSPLRLGLSPFLFVPLNWAKTCCHFQNDSVGRRRWVPSYVSAGCTPNGYFLRPGFWFQETPRNQQRHLRASDFPLRITTEAHWVPIPGLQASSGHSLLRRVNCGLWASSRRKATSTHWIPTLPSHRARSFVLWTHPFPVTALWHKVQIEQGPCLRAQTWKE